MWSNTDVKPVKSFWESDQSPEFWLTLRSKMSQKGAFQAHILHISESSSNGYIKCETDVNPGETLTK